MTKGITLFMTLLSISVSISTIGQNLITGRIIDQETKKPIKEATVLVPNKSIETTSNFLGYFQIMADTTDSLLIKKSFYETGIVKVPSHKGIQIQIAKRKHSDFQEGLEKFSEFFLRNIRYPEIARRNRTQGTCYVSFTIDSLGQMSNFKTIMDIGNDCGLEVTESLKKVPNQWIPAETTTTFILPVTFRLGHSQIKPKEIELPQGILLTELVVTAIGKWEKEE
jgi:hypothetical protein